MKHLIWCKGILKTFDKKVTKVETNPTEGDVVENKADENLSKTEKDVAFQNKSLRDEETRRISQTTSQDRPRKLGENDAIGL